MKKKVVHIVHDLVIGGVEVAVRSSLDYLNENYDFYVLCLGKTDEDFIKQIKHKDKIICIPVLKPSFPLQFIKIIRLLKEIKPDYILSSLWKSHMVSLMLTRLGLYPSGKIIPMYHSATFRHKVDRYLSLSILKRAKNILCDSDATRNHILAFKASRNKNIEVMSLMIETAKGRIRNFENTDQLKMVAVGRLHRIKRADRLVEISAYLAKEKVSFSLDIYGPDQGEGKMVADLINHYKLGDAVQLKGPLMPEKVLPILDQYDIFLQMSDSEGMSISVVQAMMAGLVPLVTNVGEIQHYARHNYNSYLLFPPFEEELEKYKQGLTELLADKEKLRLLSRHAMETFGDFITYKENLNKYLGHLMQPNEPVAFN